MARVDRSGTAAERGEWEGTVRQWLEAVLPPEWTVRPAPRRPHPERADIVLSGPEGERLELELKHVGEPTAAAVRAALAGQRRESLILISRRLSQRNRQIVEEHDESWFEPAGEARIRVGPLYLARERVGRPVPAVRGGTRFIADPFAGAAGRIARELIQQPDRDWKVVELARATATSPGFVSRVLSTLARDGYLIRTRGSSRVTDLEALSKAASPDQAR